VQHGDAVAKDVDPDRPLSEQGRRDIRALAMHMKNMGVQPGKILHSGKLRARQSAEQIAEVLSPGLDPVQADGLNPNDDPAVLIKELEKADGNMLIASHMPFVSRLCSTLLTGVNTAAFASTPGTLFCLETSDGQWQLACMLRPDCLHAPD
jgi:phosphohistidine phosphatase